MLPFWTKVVAGPHSEGCFDWKKYMMCTYGVQVYCMRGALIAKVSLSEWPREQKFMGAKIHGEQKFIEQRVAATMENS